MPFRYSPDNMYRPFFTIPLKHQHRWAFGIVWIILYNNGLSSTLDNLASKKIIR